MRLLLNSMGDEQCRPAYRDEVAAYIRSHSEGLCDECNRRAESNPLRAFDCKNPACVKLMSAAPLLRDELCDACAAHYLAVKALVTDLGIPFTEDPSLVRGLDYYTRTVFEIQVDAGLGSQNAIGGGGRYDRLVEEYGGAPTPGIGFALGFERTLLAMEAAGAVVAAPASAQVFVAAVDAGARDTAFRITSALRDAGIAADCDHQARSLKSQMKQANRIGARFALFVGPAEIEADRYGLRDLTSSADVDDPTADLSLAGIAATLARLLGNQG
jgi:histidyl-tRNA synthetase